MTSPSDDARVVQVAARLTKAQRLGREWAKSAAVIFCAHLLKDQRNDDQP